MYAYVYTILVSLLKCYITNVLLTSECREEKNTCWGFEPENLSIPHNSSDQKVIFSVRVTNYELIKLTK